MPLRVLSIDGGGIQGILPARVLRELETLGQRPIAKQFDLLAGTSSGAILALALSLTGPGGRPRYSAAELLELYLARGYELFPRPSLPRRLLRLVDPSSSVGARRPRRLLEGFFGEARFGDARPEVIVPTFDLGQGVPVLLRSTEFAGNSGPLMSEVALATCAAPSHLPPVQLELGSKVWTLAHGGLAANNPAVYAFATALGAVEPEEVVIVSLGSGGRYSRASSRRLRQARQCGFAAHLDTSSEAQHHMLAALLAAAGDRARYWRIQTSLNGATGGWDDIATLALDADEMVDKHEAQLRAAAEALA